MAHKPVRPGADPQWQELHAAADAQEPALVAIFLRALASWLTLRAWSEVQAAILRNDPEGAIAHLATDQTLRIATAVEPIFDELVSTGARIALEAPSLAQETGISLRLGSLEGLPAQETADWARANAAALVREISAETRAALRDLIANGAANGTVPRETARLVESVIGLTRRQAGAVERYRDALLEDGTGQAMVDRLVERMAGNLLKQRATTIARTEASRALNAGRQAQWQRNVADGVLSPDRWEQEWTAVTDERECPVCEGLDGTRAPIGGEFPEPGGLGPPQHPACRCSVVISRRGE